jgi:Peptidase S24-like
MPKAIPASAPALPSKPPAKLPHLFSHAEIKTLPKEFALRVNGDCMVPEIGHGAIVHVNRSGPIKVGDIVVIWRRPELVKPGESQCMMKRLTLAVPPFVTFPHKDHPDSNALPVLCVHQENPPRGYYIKCSDVIALHRVIGPISPDLVQRAPKPVPKRTNLRVVKKGGARG